MRIFFDNKGNFQWASVTAFISLIIGSISICNNNKTLNLQKELNVKNFEDNKALNIQNFKGNVVATSRIEWIQEVRKKSVDFISACYELIRNVNNSENNTSDIKALKNTIEKNANLLILYFGPDKNDNRNNDFILFLVSTLRDKLINDNKDYDTERIKDLNSELIVLRDFLRIYLKAEWKRANGEISDKCVQNYLEEHELYKRIRSIYENGFNCYKEHSNNFYDQLEKKHDNN